MLRILTCLRDQHDWRLVLLAVLVCAVSTSTAVLLLREARDAESRRRTCIVIAGLATGFGIWATHFIAMLAYHPGLELGFHAGITAASLVLAAALTSSGFVAAMRVDRRALAIIGGLIVSAGIAGMHYVGMAALEIPAALIWSWDLVLVSIAAGAAFTVPALRLAASRKGLASGAAASLLMVLGIAVHHFVGMGAVTVVPTHGEVEQAMLISPNGMSVALASAAVMILILCAGAAAFRTRARAVVRAREREFRILVQGITDCALYMLSLDGRVISWNAGAERLKGYTAEEAIGSPLERFYTDEDRAEGKADAALATLRATGKFHGEGWRCRKDGSRFWAEVTMERVLDEHGELCGYAKITRDISDRKATSDRVRTVTENLDIALENMEHGICLFDAEERIVLANRRVSEMFRIAPDACPPGTLYRDTIGVALQGLTGTMPGEAHIADVYERHRACLERPGGGTVIGEFGEHCALAVSYRPLPDGGFVVTYVDITESRRSQAKIAHMAMHDGLTGLPNRAHFNQRLDLELSRREGGDTRVAAIAIDLDRFKDINDARGHGVGDEVLKSIAAKVSEGLEEGEFFARFGGDEFAAVKPFTRASELEGFLRKLERALGASHATSAGEIASSASLGIAIAPDDGVTGERLMNNADLAMYRAKKALGEKICYYESNMDEQARLRRALAADIRTGMERGEFSLAYQVQRSLATQEVVGYEALLRWVHPRQGPIPPSDFIPVAEESGAIIELGEWVLRRACQDAAAWGDDIKIAVNLSPLQFAHPDLPGLVRSILVETGLSPRRLELEITESTLIGDKARALHILRQIKGMGVTIAIDDFGTGYSSLDTLNSFPFDKIKIDRSFLSEALHNGQAHAIIRAVLALGASMGVPVLAEGIETEAQLELLRADGCAEGQGYLFGRPGPLEESAGARAVA